MIVASRRKKYDVASPLKIIRRGWLVVVVGAGGGGWEEADLIIAAPMYTIPNTAPTVSFDVCN